MIYIENLKIKSNKPSLILCGFFGRGNCGDEALLQCVYEIFFEEYEIIIALDQYGAFAGFWDWYPYNKSTIVHLGDISVIDQNFSSLAGIIICGGGLPIGFALNFIIQAKVRGIPCVSAGTDAIIELQTIDIKLLKNYTEWFNFFSVRNKMGYQAYLENDIKIQLAGDWALRLQADTSEDLKNEKGSIFITLREDNPSKLHRDYQIEIVDLIKFIKLKKYNLKFLPFSPEDEKFIYTLKLNQFLDIERNWWNPRRMKQLIQNSYMTISYGRFHPIIFSAFGKNKIAPIIPSWWDNKSTNKIGQICAEYDIETFYSVKDFMEQFENISTIEESVFINANLRLEHSIQEIKRIFFIYAQEKGYFLN